MQRFIRHVGRIVIQVMSVFPICSPLTLLAAREEFRWSWQSEEKAILGEREETVAPPSLTVTAATGRTETGGMDVTAYARLLQENLQLRKKIDAVEKEKETIEQTNARLTRERSDMEQRIARLTALMQQLEAEKAHTAAHREQMARLEARLADAEKEKKRLEDELTAWKCRQASVLPSIGSTASTVPLREEASSDTRVAPESDLFRDLQRENFELRERLARAESAREEARRARESLLQKQEDADRRARHAERERQELEKKLAAIQSAEQRQKEERERLSRQIPQMEQEIAALRAALAQRASAATTANTEVETLRLELEKREDRLRKAERMAALLEEAHEKVLRASQMEKRDLHYNLGVIYAREGRPKDAEREYLCAFRLDPRDADVHFNLGILYEEALGNKARAILHYRKYLALNPGAPDADKVRGWIQRLETE